MWAERLRCEDYQTLIDRGWRRSGKYIYKPKMDETCCPQYTIRCHALNFKPSKSQKKVIKHLNRFLSDGLLKRNEGPQQDDDIDDNEHMFMPEQPADVELSKIDFSSAKDDISESKDNFSGNFANKDGNLVSDESFSESNVLSNKRDLKGNRNNMRETVESLPCSGEGIIKRDSPSFVKKGEGADPSKPPCKKAKLLRLERKKQKLLEKGIVWTGDESKEVGMTGKSLEEFLNEMPNELKHKLQVS